MPSKWFAFGEALPLFAPPRLGTRRAQLALFARLLRVRPRPRGLRERSRASARVDRRALVVDAEPRSGGRPRRPTGRCGLGRPRRARDTHRRSPRVRAKSPRVIRRLRFAAVPGTPTSVSRRGRSGSIVAAGAQRPPARGRQGSWPEALAASARGRPQRSTWRHPGGVPEAPQHLEPPPHRLYVGADALKGQRFPPGEKCEFFFVEELAEIAVELPRHCAGWAGDEQRSAIRERGECGDRDRSCNLDDG